MALWDLIKAVANVADDMILENKFKKNKELMSMDELKELHRIFLHRANNWTDDLAKEARILVSEVEACINKADIGVRCSDCSGTGRYFSHHDDDDQASCLYCGGSGYIRKAG